MRREPERARWPSNLRSLVHDAPREAATRSAIMKPALWRVCSYSRPGLPRPTTRRMGGTSFKGEPVGESALETSLFAVPVLELFVECVRVASVLEGVFHAEVAAGGEVEETVVERVHA